MNPSTHVIVVGAGPGGLCAAMLLASRGFRVTVLEKTSGIGGRSGRLTLGDYVFDRGSTLLMMRFVADEMFELAGRRLEDEVDVVPVEPMYRLVFGGNGRRLDAYADSDEMQRELRRFASGAEFGLRKFLRREQERLEHLYPVLQKSWPSLASLADPAAVLALPYVGLHRSLHDTAARYFDDPELQLAFSFQSAYLGMSPWDCPGGFEMVPYVEHAWGVDHLRGGINSLCTAMARAASEAGAEIRTRAEVSRLLVEGGQCSGVELVSGEIVRGDAVVINADAVAALQRLLRDDVSPRFSRSRLEHVSESCSTFMLYLGLDVELPLEHHTFLFADDYRAEMDRLFRTGEVGDDVSIYACNPVRSDPTVAPYGHSALYLLALVPNERTAIDWSVEAPRMRARVLRALNRLTGVAVEPHVRVEAMTTPADWRRLYNVSHGAVFGPAHNISQLLAFRLPHRLPSPRNVFLTGGGTSPGSGLPTILESARIASRLICEDHAIPFPASRPLPPVPVRGATTQRSGRAVA